VVWGHVRGTWMRDSRRQRTYWVTVVEDITARKQAEVDLKRALTEAEDARDKIDSIISSVSGGLIVADPEEKVILVNEAVEGLLGIPASEALGKPMSEIFRDRFFQERFRELTVMRLSGFQADLELPVDEFEVPRILRTRASVMQNKHGRFTGTVTILYDVTRERKLDRLKSEFISTAAHELHTPLAVLMGYSELLLHPEEFGEFSPEMQREFVGEIYEKCEALASLVDDLLDISRIESGREIPLMILPPDFRKTVEKVVNRFRMNYRSHSFRLKLHSGGPKEFLLDEKKMIQVLENLLSNAVKYSPQGGPVLIEGKVDGNSYRISVTDRGIGMTGEQLEKVFEKFYRADSSNTAVRGLGLGMSIAKNIVEAHGGQIWAESRPQEGTRVFFTLPLLLP
jgi:PAS domain S-box-containing protein